MTGTNLAQRPEAISKSLIISRIAWRRERDSHPMRLHLIDGSGL